MYSILVDVTKCTGCAECADACIDKNNLDAEKSYYDFASSINGLSADRLLTVKKIKGGRFARLSCMHCVEPACVSACLVGGITKSGEGPVIYDPDKCIGCRYCMLACPFHIPQYEWDAVRPYMKKCNMCYDRVKENKLPACVEACPQKAIIFGERKKLLNQAHSIINKNKNRYIDHVWGEREFGGTSVLYISDISLETMGWQAESLKSIPELTEPLIEKTPVIALTVGSFLLGINWIIKRKKELSAENAEIDNDKEETREKAE